VDQVQLLGRVRQREARPPRGGVHQEHDVALDGGRRVDAGKRAAAQQRGDLLRAADQHHRLGAQRRAQPPAGSGDDGVDAIGCRVEQHVAAGDEGADAGAAGPRERVA